MAPDSLHTTDETKNRPYLSDCSELIRRARQQERQFLRDTFLAACLDMGDTYEITRAAFHDLFDTDLRGEGKQA